MELSELWRRDLILVGKTLGQPIRISIAKEVCQQADARRFPSPIIFIVICGQKNRNDAWDQWPLYSAFFLLHFILYFFHL